MFRHTTILTTLALHCSCTVSALAQELPNLIFILTDDQGIDAIEWPPNTRADERIHTPRLNRMAEQGVSFTNCRVNPNCSPTRACLMTGRSALDTGVVGVIGRYVPLDDPSNACESTALTGTVAKVTNRLALQTQERTIAEVLQEMGYYTILIDKWHLGYNEDGENRLQDPLHKGFDVFADWRSDICTGYGQPGYYYADSHMVRMAEKARIAVNDRPDPQNTPYALFYHTITPHIRHSDGTSGWWDIYDKQRLLNHTRNFGDTTAERFFKNLEAIDSVLFLDLLQTGDGRLGVLDGDWNYRSASNTIVFFVGDNGTDASLTSQRGKNTLFERGVRVPCFVMGEGITGNPQYEGTIDDRQISHVDFYDTICDIVQAPPEVRDNSNGTFPRRGESFAYNIGYSETERTRDYTCSSLGNVKFDPSYHQVWRVALTHRPPGALDDRFKLVCNSGGAGLDDMSADEFYDLRPDIDPDEQDNRVVSGMTFEQLAAYYQMRDVLSDHWPTAVSAAPEPDIIPTYWADHRSGDYVLMVYVVEYDLQHEAYDKFYNVEVDPDREHNLLEGWMTPEEEQLYGNMRDAVEGIWSGGQRIIPDPDLRVIDVDAEATMLLAVPAPMTPPPGMAVGHQDGSGSNHREFRALLRFDVSDYAFPDGFDFTDAIDAQLIVHFKHDSQEFNPNFPTTNDYMSRDSDTGVINVFKMLGPWSVNPWVNFDSETSLGQFDPPAHIIAIPFDSGYATKIRMTPMPQGTPVSFGNSLLLKSVIDGWRATPAINHGVVLIAEELPLFLTGTSFRDQQVTFQTTDAVIRLRLERQ